jgi:hypothetical protein
MAIVHVRLDVDSDVHPELYAMLAAIDRAASRSERVRQLASSGLIWEHLRVQGPTRMTVDIEVGNDEALAGTSVAPQPAPPPIDPPPPPAPPPIDPPPPPAPPPPIDPPRPVPVPRAPAALPPSAPPRIAADTQDAAGGPKRAARSRGSPPRNLPILYDAVELSEVEDRQSAPDSAQAPAPSAPGESASAPARKAGPRPRLMRMKEKGLFNNG